MAMEPSLPGRGKAKCRDSVTDMDPRYDGKEGLKEKLLNMRVHKLKACALRDPLA